MDFDIKFDGYEKTLENSEGAIKKGQSRETDNIESTRRRKKKERNTICVGHHNTQTNMYKVNKTFSLLQTTGGKDEQNIVFIRKSQWTSHQGTQSIETHSRTTKTTK